MRLVHPKSTTLMGSDGQDLPEKKNVLAAARARQSVLLSLGK
jgi:hypothetical protein